MKTKRENELGDVKLAPPDTLREGQSRQGGVAIVLLDLLLQTRELGFKKLLKFCLIIDGL